MPRRRRWRESVKSFIGSHIDPEKEEQLKGTKTDVEEKVKKILKLIKEEDLEEKDRISGESSKKEPLADLIEDFHTHYQTLYEQYDHLSQQLKKKFHSKRKTDTSSSSSSDAEPDYSSKDKESKNGQLQNENRIMTDGIMQELQTVNLEVSDLKLKLEAATEEKESLNLEYQKALNKIEEEEEITLDLKHEVGKLEAEHKKLLTENEELHQKLDAASKMESELNQKVEEVNKEKLGLTVEKETAIKSFEEGKRTIEEFKIVTNQLKDEKGILIEQLENLEEKISVMRQQMESSEQQVLDLSQNLTAAEKENKSLTLEASLLDKRLDDVHREKANLEREKQTAAKNAEEDKKITEGLRVLVDQLKVEKVALEEELKTFHGELSNLKQQLESSEQKSSDLVDNLRAAEEENNSLTWKASEVTNEIQLAQSTIKELVAGSNELKEKMGEKEKELLSLAKVHEEHEAHSSARIKELESQLTGLELEIQSLQNHNRDMAMHIEKEVSEAKQLRREILEQQVRISECEIISKEREDELSILRKKLEDNENESMARVENLKAQLNTLLVDMDSLRAQKAELEDKLVSSSNEASNQIKCLMDKINLLQQELESLHSQKAETEVQLESRSREISDYLIQLDNLKEEIRNKSNEQQTALEERQSLMTRLNNLTMEAEILSKQKSEIEEQMKIVVEETAKFRQEIVTLQGKTSILEATVAERELQFSQLQEVQKTREDEASSQIYSLTAQVHSLQQELDCLKIENEQLKQKLKKERQEFSESLTQIEDHKNELMNHVMDQQRMLLEKEEAYKKLTEEYKQIEGWLQECKSNLEAAEKKVIDMGEEFEKNAGSKDQIVAELEETVEDLKRDLDMKGDELNTLVDNVRTIEVKLRLSNQKLRVTEQLLTENEESFRKIEGKYQQEQKVLEQRISTLSGIIAANSEAYQMMVADITEILSSTSMGMEALTLRYEEDSSRYKHRILEISNEIQIAKNFVLKINNHKEQLRKEAEELKMQLWDAKDRESALTENVEELELKLRREGGEKENLARDIKQLEAKLKLFEKMVKEKDEGILDLGEEKREVIRQLCLWIDYHRSRYDYLREILMRTHLRGQRPA